MVEELIVKKWGNSLAIVIPKDVVKEKNLKENQKVVIDFIKKADLRDIFGSLKLKKSAQSIKDMVREGSL